MLLKRIFKFIFGVVSNVYLMFFVHHQELYLDQVKYIKSFGYPVEKHIVETDDGYLLSIIRIPYGTNQLINQEYSVTDGYNFSTKLENRPVVYLQPGICCSAAIYLNTGPQRAIGFLLADFGYDVWIANSRGTILSRNHTKHGLKHSKTYWEFSWHEIGILDIPNTIDYILAYTNQKQVSYIGYSQGTTTLYVMLSEKPEYNDKVNVAITYGPVAFMENVPSNMKIFSALRWYKYFKPIFDLLKVIHIYDMSIVHRFPLLTLLANQCNYQTSKTGMKICTRIWNYFGDSIEFFTPSKTDARDLGNFLSIYPDGCSVNSFEHYRQLNYKGGFTKFDFGRRQNLKVYGQDTPPSYNLSNIKIPVYLMYSDSDLVGTTKDVQKLHNLLPNSKLLRINYPQFRHGDFWFGIHAVAFVFNDIFKILRYYNSLN